jgi:two-component system sensor histidine kinase YesM
VPRKSYFSFKRKIWAGFTLLLAVSILVAGGVSYNMASRVIEENALKLSQDAVNKSTQVLEEKLRSIMVSVMALMISEPIKDVVDDTRIGRVDRRFVHFANLENVFAQARINHPLIHSMLLVTPIGEFYSFTTRRALDTPFYESPMYKLVQTNKHVTWIEAHEDTLFSKKDQVITLVLPVIAEDYPLEDAYLVVNIDAKALKEVIIQNVPDSIGDYALLHRDGSNVLDDGDSGSYNFALNVAERLPEDRLSGHLEFHEDGQDYMINYSFSQVIPDWLIVKAQTKDELFRQVESIKTTTLILVITCVIVSLFLANALTRLLLRPLVALQSVMKKVEQNNLSARYVSTGRDEINQLGVRFNMMLDQTEKLIEEVRFEGGERRKAEIKALSAQIDPHFLYNTLNTIYWKAGNNQMEDVKAMVLAFSRLFKLGLNQGQEMTTLQQEVEHVKQYLMLQHQCYEGLFEYEIHVEDEQLLDVPVLRLIIQPLVENSILHGFSDMDSQGLVRIRIYQEANQLIIAVNDNGKGMDILEVEQELYQQSVSNKGYALRNVYHRLQLCYGKAGTIKLSSTPYEETQVILSIPFIESTPKL